MDTIVIRNLTVNCALGVTPEECERRRPVIINLRIQCDLKSAGCSDRLEDTVDYACITDAIVSLVSDRSFCLVEALAEAVAGCCLSVPSVHAVTVSVEKPGALAHVESVGVEIERRRTSA